MMNVANKMQMRSVTRAAPMSVRAPAFVQPIARRSMQVVRFEDKDKQSETPLSQEQLNEVGKTQVGDISPRKAEMRADLGSATSDLNQLQAFDGPAPETINGRSAMLGVLVALAYEFKTGMGVKQQIIDHPFLVIGSFVIIAIASYIPLSKGITRKEGYANGIWTPAAENQNGR
ncbi:MAG: hypothetical protein WDW38_008942 [Sanguina aurantia]